MYFNKWLTWEYWQPEEKMIVVSSEKEYNDTRQKWKIRVTFHGLGMRIYCAFRKNMIQE